MQTAVEKKDWVEICSAAFSHRAKERSLFKLKLGIIAFISLRVRKCGFTHASRAEIRIFTPRDIKFRTILVRKTFSWRVWLHHSPSARAANSHSSGNVSSHSYRNVLSQAVAIFQWVNCSTDVNRPEILQRKKKERTLRPRLTAAPVSSPSIQCIFSRGRSVSPTIDSVGQCAKVHIGLGKHTSADR